MDEILKAESKLLSWTGIKDLEILDVIVFGCQNVEASRSPKSHCLDIKSRVILVLIKLKLDMNFLNIADLFGISSPTCSKYFRETLSIIRAAIDFAVYWPTITEIQNNMTKYFMPKYSRTRVILDCTEILVESPYCLNCQSATYSHYKSRFTAKYLVGVTPAGLISYLSPGYSGRASDKFITNAEKVLDLCDSGDQVMVDKGFFIEKECEERGIELIRPGFLRNKDQFEEWDSNENVSIAAARVHVERVIGRAKKFQILCNRVPRELMDKIDEIFYVICLIVNLSVPQLSDDRFYK
jgi:hypothetical protein